MLRVSRLVFSVRGALLFVSLLVAGALVASDHPVPSQAAASQGTVKLEWLGHLFYRLTSPQGVVVLTSPWLSNADGPVLLDELTRTDIILVPNSHPDDMGNPIEIAAVSGAMVIAPGPLGRWLIDNGLDESQFFRTNIGSPRNFNLRDVLIRVGPSSHDNTLPTGADGGPAASFFMTFENGVTVFFSGHGTMVTDLAIYASVYQPDVAIVGLNQAAEFAQVARLMTMDNPKLRTVIPSHIRPGASIVNEAMVEMDRLGLGHLMFVPELRRVYEY